ncbi:hypothetical protein KAI11_02310 [Candidatus Bathyarchaeota archaeon]|nr:hypothetical protein [Candidatus Bathyarchaeota archaeon]
MGLWTRCVSGGIVGKKQTMEKPWRKWRELWRFRELYGETEKSDGEIFQVRDFRPLVQPKIFILKVY